MKDTSFPDQDYRIWAKLSQARDTTFRVRERELNRSGISTIEARVLAVIEAMNVPSTPSELARWMIREPHTISKVLIRMEKEGLIKKTKDLERKNLVRISMTKKGQQAYKQSIKAKSLHRIFSTLSEEQRISCVRILL